jgi:hypothetical protein
MSQEPQFRTAMQQLDALLANLDQPAPPDPPPDSVVPPSRRVARATRTGRRRPAPKLPPRPPGAPPPRPRTPSPPTHPPTPTSAALTRLLVGAALLGLDGLAARTGSWEAQAGIAPHPQTSPPPAGSIGSGRFRHALIGWIFETEARLRPQGNPISWLRSVVVYLFGTIFTVILELLPIPRPGRWLAALNANEPTDADTQRWIKRGQAEELPSRRFAQAASADLVDATILYLARRPAVGQALGEIVRTPAMDDTITHIVRTPAMDDIITHIVRTPAMSNAIETIAESPALVALVRTQGRSVASSLLEEVRDRAAQSDLALETFVRRRLRRRPRQALPREQRGLMIDEERL